MHDQVLFNEKLVQAINSGDFSKIAAAIAPYTRQRIYEMSFIESVLKVRDIEVRDLIPEVDSDTSYVLGELEQNTDKAITMNFQGKPYTVTKSGRRFKIPIGYNSTPITQKSEQEMLSFTYDLFKDLEQKEIFALHRLRDVKFLQMAKEAVALSGKQKDFALAGDGVVYPEKDHFVELANLLETGDRTGIPDENVLACTKYLCSRTILNDLARWSSIDVDVLASELVVKGWASARILDKELIVSTKADLFVEKDGNKIYDVIWAFPDEEYIGEVIHINGMEIKPEIWRENGTHNIYRRSSEYFGAAIGNYNGAARIRLQRKEV
jgi:hypothetical protein